MKFGKMVMGSLTVLLVMLLPLLVVEGSSLEPVPFAAEQASSVSGWEIVAAPSQATMYSLDMLDANDGWAGGMAGFVFHYVGGQWEGVPTSFDRPFAALDMVDAGSGWGVASTGQILRYDGSSWLVHSKPDGALSDLDMLSATEGWATGGSAILRYDVGSDSWVEVSNPSSYYLKAIDMVSSNDGWIAGAGGTMLHWDGGSWTGGTVEVGVVFADINMVSGTDGWAVGGGGAIYHFDGTGWTAVESPTDKSLSAVDFVTSDDGWAVGEDGVLLHWDGDAWTEVASPTSNRLNTVQMVSSDDVWAMGSLGTILHYTGEPANLTTSTKVVDKRHAASGEELEYTITVRNSGTKVASSVAVTDTIPSGATYVAGSATTTQGTVAALDPLLVTVGDLAGGGEVTIIFRVTVDDEGTACRFIRNEALIGAEGIEALMRSAVTSVGDCQQHFVPYVVRGE